MLINVIDNIVNTRKLITGTACLVMTSVCLEAILKTNGHDMNGISNILADAGQTIGNCVSSIQNWIGHKTGQGYLLSPHITEYIIGLTTGIAGIEQIYQSFSTKPKEK